MAGDTAGIHELVISTYMAVLAGLRLMRALQREGRRGVIEGGRFPCGLCVTREAVVAELSGAVIRIRGRVECCLMALPAVLILQRVVAVHVALLAGDGHMSALQRERGAVVVERRRFVRDLCVALQAVMAELTGHVIRRFGLLERRAVAGVTPGVRELVIAVDVAALAGQWCVRALEREGRAAMTERGGFPAVAAVALRAVVREFARGVIGIFCVDKIGVVTLRAVGVGELIVAVYVASFACDTRVFAAEREARFVVIQHRRFPRAGGVADGTIVRELARHVIGRQCRVELLTVARKTIRVLERVIAVCVAALAGLGLMPAREREGGRGVVEGRGFPRGVRVAGLAVAREAACGVVGLFRARKILLMTLQAVGVFQRVVAIGMAALTRDRAMRALEPEIRA